MAIRLEKGQRINLKKENGNELTNFCVGCNWGAIVTHSSKMFGLVKSNDIKDVDLDLSCIMLNANGEICDHIYSPFYKKSFLDYYGMPPGKVDSLCGALHHSGDDMQGDKDGDDGLDNEIITVNLAEISPAINQIFFFLNNCGQEDFSQIPYAAIRMYEGTPTNVKNVFAEYNVSAQPQYKGMTALIMGKLYQRNNEWKFGAIGDAFPDANICLSIARILKNYAR